jgi:hypothetical protein
MGSICRSGKGEVQNFDDRIIRKWEDNINMDFMEIVCEDGRLMKIAQNRVLRRRCARFETLGFTA